ncbi:hypothetical protein C5B93_03545 [Rathayibacter sp. AY1A2]|uniref:hypothetical protein n=1 Tax=Rathayibacter sp. AY1A2 TaxID=2080520 RepID=UPI000CE83535|nr:hypothetical protein [Rathayibacter sp. AY1A2]PPF40668.1 hypothetical protein C5B93_03545 [Rathayibacter sp. AY1A2]
MKLYPDVISTLRAQEIDPDEWAREHGSPSAAEWAGDECGCDDDRCIGHHHDEHEDCGCFPAMLEQHFAQEKACGYKTLKWRTTPVRVVVSAESDLEDFGLLDLADQDQIDLSAATDVDTAAMLQEHTTAEETARIAAIAAEMSDPEQVRAEHYDQLGEIHQAVLDRARDAGDPRYDVYYATERLSRAITEVWDRDVAAYQDAYLAVIRDTLTARGLTTGVEVVAFADRDTGIYDEDLADDLRDVALLATPLPVIGAPGEERKITVDALRAAGLSYIERARAVVSGEAAPE